MRSVHGRPRAVSSHDWIQPRSMFWAGVRSKRPSSLRSAATTVSATPRGLELGDARAVALELVGLVLAVLAQLLADGLHLAAQQELPLLVLHAVADVTAIFSVSSSSARASLAHSSTLADPHLDVDGLEQLDLALGRQVGPPAGQVGERAGVVALLGRRQRPR